MMPGKYLGSFKKIDSPIYIERELDIKDVSISDIWLKLMEKGTKIPDGRF